MSHLRLALRAIALFTFIIAVSAAAQAQATRTWVSGVGDDVNPCSRTAPCKTFAGAISKTAIGGEIDALDPGGFGTLTITKSITVDGASAFGSTLSSGVTGFTINIASGNANDPERRVTLRRLSINGTGLSGTAGVRTGLKGIRVLAAKSVFIENCYIQNFTQEGVDTATANEGGGLYVGVKDTNITNCNVGVNLAVAGGFAVGHMDNVRIERMTSHGVSIGNGGNMKARNCAVIFNGGDGFVITNTVANATLFLEHTFIASNQSAGVRNGATGSIVDLSNTSVIVNSTGLASSSAAAGGGINTHGNNQIAGNTAPGTTPNPVGQQ
jgi:hypothetical protein